MKYINLTKNLKTLVDLNDYENLIQYKWCSIQKRDKFYAGRGQWIKDRTKIMYLHRILLNAKPKEFVDHINGDTLDNRRINLRLCSNKDNVRNQSLNKKNKSGYKGVRNTNRNLTKKYLASIGVNNKSIYLGYFHTAKKAAIAYNNAAIEYFGKF